MNITKSVQRLTRVDYLDGLGIAVGTHDISLVQSTKRFFQVALKEVRTIPLPEFSERQPDRLDQPDQPTSRTNWIGPPSCGVQSRTF